MIQAITYYFQANTKNQSFKIWLQTTIAPKICWADIRLFHLSTLSITELNKRKAQSKNNVSIPRETNKLMAQSPKKKTNIIKLA